MKRGKSKVRAQRKFAQGGYVPPPSTPAPTQVTMKASHREVHARGPVTKILCSADLFLTVTSLKRAVDNNIEWPRVVLQDCDKVSNVIPDKKKNGVKKNYRRTRSTRKRLSSESDSEEEDTPLSHLLKLDTSSRVEQIEKKNKVGLYKVVKVVTEDKNQTKILTQASELEEPTKRRSLKRHLKVATLSSEQEEPPKKISLKCHLNAQNINRRKSKTPSEPEEPLKRRLLKCYSNPGSSTSKSNLSLSLPESDDLLSSTKKRTSERCAKRSRPIYTDTPTLMNSTASTSSTENNQPLQESAVKKNQRKFFKQTEEQKKSTCLAKPKFKKKQVTFAKDIAKNNYFFNVPKHQSNGEAPLVKQNIAVADIVCLDDAGHGSNTENEDVMPPPNKDIISADVMPTLASQDILLIDSNTETVKSTNDIDIIDKPLDDIHTGTEEPSDDICINEDADVSNIRVVSVTTQCPLELIDSLSELLGSEVGCNKCRRCKMLTLLKKIQEKVTKNKGDGPDINILNMLTSPYAKLMSINQILQILQMLKIDPLALKILYDLNPKDAADASVEKELPRLNGLHPEDSTDVAVEIIISQLSFFNTSIYQYKMQSFNGSNNKNNTESQKEKSDGEIGSAVTTESLETLRKENYKPTQFKPAKVYYPTDEEFKDPITYIKSIEPEASKYGMCKIIPPTGFHVPCHLDENSSFGTYNQHLHRLFHRWGPNTAMFASMQASMKSQAAKDKESGQSAPLFFGQEVDLEKLYRLVTKQGGIGAYMSHTVKWARIAAQMNYVSPSWKPDSKKLENIYCKHVLPYETLTPDEKKDADEKALAMWKIRVKNAMLRAKRPLQYQRDLLRKSCSRVPDYEVAFPEPDLSDLYDQCLAIYDRIEECISKGRSMNLATFRRVSTLFERMHFPNGFPCNIAEIEEKYWEILTLKNEHVCVLTAFIDTSVNNLGHESDPQKPGGSHPWNLKNIGENPENVLRLLGKALSVTVPTLCLSQLYSTNCWHKDPHKLAWLDYMHEGATKIWYSVPESGEPSFQTGVRMVSEASVQDKGIWLASDTTMVPPATLMEHGVPIYRIEQNPNEYIVVFPGAYASSISTGFSVAESIYFESDRWLNYVQTIFKNMRKDCEPAMFSGVLLIMNVVREPSIRKNILSRMFCVNQLNIRDELQARRKAKWLNCKITTDTRGRIEGTLLTVAWPNQEECCLCRMPLVFSKMSSYASPRLQMCAAGGIKYMNNLMKDPKTNRPELPLTVLTVYYTNHELLEMFDAMKNYIGQNNMI